MTKYIVAIHSCGGSMGEAVWPQWTRTVESEMDKEKLEKKFQKLLRKSWDDEAIAVVTEIEDPLDVDSALEELSKDEQFFEEDEEPLDADEQKVEDMMGAETEALEGLFKDTYHKPARQTVIVPANHEFTRYPVTDDWAGDLTEHGLGYDPTKEDPLADWTDEQLTSLTDEQFANLLKKKRLERAAEDAKEL